MGNKLTEATLYSQKFAVLFGGVGDDGSSKSGGKEVFVGGGSLRNGRCVSGSTVVRREAQPWRGPIQLSGDMMYQYFLCPPGPRGAAYSGRGGGKKGS